MNYRKIYDDLMLNRLNIKPKRIIEKKNGDYFEGHHIIPKSKGGLVIVIDQKTIQILFY